MDKIGLLKQTIQYRLEEETKKLIEEAKKKLEQKTPEIIAGIVVDIMGMAEIDSTKDKIIFTIKKDNKK